MKNEFLEEDLKYCDEQISTADEMIRHSNSPYSQIAIDTWTKYRDRWKRIKDSLNKPIDIGYRMCCCQEQIPRSAKVMPVWIKVSDYNNGTYDLVFLSEDEEYFVSVDHKRIYLVTPDILWTMIPMPYEYCK